MRKGKSDFHIFPLSSQEKEKGMEARGESHRARGSQEVGWGKASLFNKQSR